MKSILSDKDEIFLFYESIRQLRPKTVLDIGMVFPHCGAICRQMADATMDPDLFLCGLTDTPDTLPAVYQVIYNEILSPPALLSDSSQPRQFDLALWLLPDEIGSSRKDLFPYLKTTASRFLCRKSMEKETRSFFPKEKPKTILYEGYSYLLFSFTG